MSSEHLLVRAIGYIATVLQGDPAVLGRWLFLRRYLTPGPLHTMDAGSGSGAMAIYAAKRGHKVTGVSLSQRDNQVAAERLKILGLSNAEFVTGDLRELEKVAAGWPPFDQVICFEVIEHIKDDRKLVRDLANVLKPGGVLLLTTPYKHYNPLPGDGISEVEDGSHVRWGYTFMEMREMLDAAGLEVRVEEYITGYWSQLVMRVQRTLVMKGVPGKIAWLLTLPLRLLQALDPLAARIKNYPALSIGVVAVKR